MTPAAVEAAAGPDRDDGLADGLAMSLAAGGAAGVGMVSWIVAARALSPAELGTATAFVSAFLLVAGMTELNVGVGLLRWLPAAGSRSRLLLVRGLLSIASLSGTVGALYLLLPDTSVIVDAVVGPVGPGGTGGDRLLGAAVFVLAAVLYALFQQQDFVLVGLRRPWWAPARTALFAVGRLGILLAAGASLTTGGVVASWILPTAACVLLVTAQAWWLTRRAAPGSAAPGRLPGRREVLGFLGPTYLGQAATSVLLNQVPLLVVFRFGPAEGAGFFLVWQAVTVVDVLATYFATSMSAGIAREPDRAAEISRATRRRLLVLLLPALAVGVAIASPVLSLFGEVYTDEAPVLQVMLVGLALRLVVVHRLAEHQAHGRGVRFARLAVVGTAVVVAAAALVPVGASAPLLVFAVAFAALQGVLAAVVTVRRHRDHRTASTLRTPRAEDRP